jgi:hypothetical protein
MSPKDRLLKNPRGDSKLKRLDDALKDEILRRTLQPGIKQSDIIQWLEDECAVLVSPATLSEFCSWWPARKRALADEAACSAWMEHQRETTTKTPEEIFRDGQAKFAQMAIAREDSKTWAITTMAADSKDRVELERTKSQQRAELIALKREELVQKKKLVELAERRVVLLEAKLREVKEAVIAAKDQGLTAETLAKIEQAASIL